MSTEQIVLLNNQEFGIPLTMKITFKTVMGKISTFLNIPSKNSENSEVESFISYIGARDNLLKNSKRFCRTHYI